MENMKSKVYVLLNEDNRIIRCEGGYTMQNIQNIDDWVFIDEGTGDKYNHAQGNYFPLPLITNSGAYRYKLVDGKPVECTAEEIKAQEEANVRPAKPTQLDRVEAQVAYTAMITDTLLEWY